MVRFRRRESVIVAAVLAISGCVGLAATSDPGGSTRLESARIATATPTLAAFVLRIAVADVSLDPSQALLAGDLARQSDRLGRVIDEDRAVFVEVLIRAVEARTDPGDAAEPLLADVTEAAPKLDDALLKLHAALEPWQRRRLEARVRARFPDWSREWNGGAAEEHPWLASLGRDRLASSTDDTVTTTRRWAEALVAEVRDSRSLDEPARRALVVRLRLARPK